MTIIKRFQAITIAYLCTLVAGEAYAFKIDTHLWLADNLYNRELKNGHVDLGETFGNQSINERAHQSLLTGREEFLIGVLGADLYPDMIVGQMTTHPGMPLKLKEEHVTPGVKQLASVWGIELEHGRGWQTDDWLNHVLISAIKVSRGRPSKEIAFAYGYLLHAAMDTWAHTYVNMYTGDLFSLTVNQETAARHTAIEGYIKNQHQKYLMKVSGGTDNLENLKAPTRFVRDTLILNRNAANQYAHEKSASHLWLMYAWWETSNRLNRNWLEIRDQLDVAVNRAVQQVLEVDALWRGAEEAKQIAAEAARVALIAKQKAETEAETALREFNAVIDQILSQFESATRETVEQYIPEFLKDTYETTKSAFTAADKARRDAVDEYSRLASESTLAGLDAAERLRQLDLRKAAEATVQNARRVAWKIVADSLVSWRSNIERGVDEYIRAWEESAREIMRDPGDRFTKGHDVIWPLKNWTVCWGPIFATPPLPISLQVVGKDICSNNFKGFTEAQEKLDLLLVNLPFDLLDMPQLKREIVAIDEFLEEKLRDSLPIMGDMIANGVGVVQMAPVAAGDIPVEAVQGYLRGSASFVAQMWEKDIDDVDLNNEFTVDGSGKNLPLFEVKGNTVQQSLEGDRLPILSPGAKKKYGFDAMHKFNPIHNAMMLSRLTFLDGNGLNKLATQAGVLNTSFTDGKPAYSSRQPAGTVLIGAIRSIDGNHQWQPVAPILPRGNKKGDYLRATGENCRRFGYPFRSEYGNQCDKDREPAGPYDRSFDREEKLQSEGGFRLWMDPKLRKQVFNKIFHGPLSPALCEKNKATIETLNIGIGCDPDYPFPDSKESGDALVRSYPGYMDTLLAGVTPTASAGMAGPTATATAPTSSTSTTIGIQEPTTSIVTSAPVATTSTTTRIQTPTSSGTVQQTAPTVTTALATVSRVTPASAAIYPGQRVIITLEGRALNTLSAVRIRQSGRDVPGFRTTMEPTSTTTQTRRRITVEAASTAAIGNYQLTLFAGRQTVAVPRGTAVAVVAPRTILQPKTVLEPKTTILPTR